MFHSVSLLSQAPLAHGSHALPSVLLTKLMHFQLNKDEATHCIKLHIFLKLKGEKKPSTPTLLYDTLEYIIEWVIFVSTKKNSKVPGHFVIVSHELLSRRYFL